MRRTGYLELSMSIVLVLALAAAALPGFGQAAQNMNQIDKVLSYGDKVLAIDPNDLNTMITLSAAIPAKLPADEAGKKAALDKAEGLGRKALAGIQPLLAQAQDDQKKQIAQI